MATQGRLDTRHVFPAADGLTEDDDRYKLVNLNASGEVDLAAEGEFGWPLLAVEGDQGATVALAGKEKVVVSGSVSAGDPLTSDANGLAVEGASSGIVNGIALEDGEDGQVVSYMIVHYEIDTTA